MKQNLRELPKFRDGLSYLYVEHGRIEQDAKAIAWYQADGKVSVPVSVLGLLMLGPGTSVTHAAIKALADNGCMVVWVGEESVRFYASGMGETRSSQNLLRQAEIWADKDKHLNVVRKMYTMRFKERLANDLTLQQIRGKEGVRVRTIYSQMSKTYNVLWQGRNYKRGTWSNADPINRALSSASACLYGICQAAIVSSGYSPALGFIHTGKQLSFVYDIADLYKAEIAVPAAFEVVSESDEGVESRVRHKLREVIRESKLLGRIITDLQFLFDLEDQDYGFDDDSARPGELWDVENSVAGGVSYGRDDSRESTNESEG